MHEMAALRTHFPDAVVGLAPELGGAVGNAREIGALLGAEVSPQGDVEKSQVEQLAMSVELKLLMGGVADSRRSAAAIAVDADDLALGKAGPRRRCRTGDEGRSRGDSGGGSRRSAA